MDVICFEDLDEFGRDLDDPLEELRQDVVHMLLESIGSNADATERSIGLDDALSGPIDRSLKQRIERKLMDDDRILAAAAIFEDAGEGRVRIKLQIQVDTTKLDISVVFDAAGNIVGTS